MPSITQSRKMRSHLVIVQNVPGLFGGGAFVDVLDAERLKDGGHQHAHVLVVVDDQNLHAVEAVCHSPRPNGHRLSRRTVAPERQG